VSTRYLVVFRKWGGARFLSHLDLQAALEYGMRRAGLPVELSEGFNPRPRYSLVTALPLGYTGEGELFELTLREELPAETVAESLGGSLPEGISVLTVEVLRGRAATATRLQSATYRIEFMEPPADLQARVQSLLDRSQILLEEERNGKLRTRDVRSLVLSLEVVDPQTMRLVTKLTGEGSIRPDEILRQMDLEPRDARVTRESIALSEPAM
jgi:radical SAM-linked protein